MSELNPGDKIWVKDTWHPEETPQLFVVSQVEIDGMILANSFIYVSPMGEKNNPGRRYQQVRGPNPSSDVVEARRAQRKAERALLVSEGKRKAMERELDRAQQELRVHHAVEQALRAQVGKDYQELTLLRAKVLAEVDVRKELEREQANARAAFDRERDLRAKLEHLEETAEVVRTRPDEDGSHPTAEEQKDTGEQMRERVRLSAAEQEQATIKVKRGLALAMLGVQRRLAENLVIDSDLDAFCRALDND